MARFYETQYIKPSSAYVPLPIDAMAARLQQMQGAQDQYRQTIEAFDKPFANLPIDQQSALEAKDWVQGQLENLRGIDYNDAANRNQIYKTIKDVRDFYGPQGQAGLLENRVNQYNSAKKHIQDTYKDNPTQMGYLLNQLEGQFYTQPQEGQQVDPTTGMMLDYQNKALRRNPQTGMWENTGISSPTEWTWKDPNKEWDDAIKSVAYDSFKSTNPSWSGTPADAVSMYFLGGGDQLTKQKIDQAMYSRFMSDPDLIKSAQAQSDYYGKGVDETQFAGLDNKGNVVWNPETLIGEMMLGRNKGASFYRDKTEHGTVTDQIKVDKAKHKLENPDITLHNEGVLAAGQTITYNSSRQKADEVRAQLATLPAKGSVGDNYQVQAQRASLEKQLAIAENYQSTLSNNYFSTDEGKTAIEDLFTTRKMAGINYKPIDTEYQVDKDGDGTYDGTAKLSDYIKTPEDFKAYMAGNLKLPTWLETGTAWTGNSWTGEQYAQTPRERFDDMFGDPIQDTQGEINFSYNAQVLTGEKGSTVNTLNTGLTDRVNQNRTNYWVEGGQDLDTYLNENLEEGDKIRVAMMDNDINGNFAHYMTVVSKDGKTKVQMPIYPKAGGREEQNMLGTRLMQENATGTDALSQDNYYRGRRMVANSRYGDALDDASANSMEASARQKHLQSQQQLGQQSNVTTSSPAQQVTFSQQNGGTFLGYYQVVITPNGVTEYQLLDNQKQPLGPRQKSMDDLRTWIYDLESSATQPNQSNTQ